MTLREKLDAYEKLMRLDKPIGILLLLWPALWGLWLAAPGALRADILIIFVLGTVLTRSAGCIVNDYADRNFDPHVARTEDYAQHFGCKTRHEPIADANGHRGHPDDAVAGRRRSHRVPRRRLLEQGDVRQHARESGQIRRNVGKRLEPRTIDDPERRSQRLRARRVSRTGEYQHHGTRRNRAREVFIVRRKCVEAARQRWILCAGFREQAFR